MVNKLYRKVCPGASGIARLYDASVLVLKPATAYIVVVLSPDRSAEFVKILHATEGELA